MTIQLTSNAFGNNGIIPAEHTCTSEGQDTSPPLNWINIPEGTKSLALIMDDPDAPFGWVHWVMYNIPASKTGLPVNVRKAGQLPDGTLQGMNDFKRLGYGGPCPPSGTHRYYFRIYALDTVLEPYPNMTKQNLVQLMNGHILAEGELMGRYSK